MFKQDNIVCKRIRTIATNILKLDCHWIMSSLINVCFPVRPWSCPRITSLIHEYNVSYCQSSFPFHNFLLPLVQLYLCFLNPMAPYTACFSTTVQLLHIIVLSLCCFCLMALPIPSLSTPQYIVLQIHLKTVSTNNNHHHHNKANHFHHYTNHHQSNSSPPSGAASPTPSQFGGNIGGTVSQHLSPIPSVCVRVPNSPGFDSEPSSPAKTIPIGKPNEFSTLVVREFSPKP